MPSIEIIEADLSLTAHQLAVVELIDAYAMDPMGNGRPLSAEVRRLLEQIERKARDLRCCKLTLEVQENNHRAIQVYEAAGFAQAVYEDAAGGSLFLAKQL